MIEIKNNWVFLSAIYASKPFRSDDSNLNLVNSNGLPSLNFRVLSISISPVPLSAIVTITLFSHDWYSLAESNCANAVHSRTPYHQIGLGCTRLVAAQGADPCCASL